MERSDNWSVSYLDWRLPYNLDSTVQDRSSQPDQPDTPDSVADNIDAVLTTFSSVRLHSDLSSLKAGLSASSRKSAAPDVVFLHIPNKYPSDILLNKISLPPSSPLDLGSPLSEPDTPTESSSFFAHILSQLPPNASGRTVFAILDDDHHVQHCSAPPDFTASGPIAALVDQGATFAFRNPLTPASAHSAFSRSYREFSSIETGSQAAANSNMATPTMAAAAPKDPYAYLKEDMVAGLLAGLCNNKHPRQQHKPQTINLSYQSQDTVTHAVGSWAFSATEFSPDELLYAAKLMFEHAFSSPTLEKWRIGEQELTSFLFACRDAYHGFVQYHNFRHAVDVMQALFSLLLDIEALPPYQPKQQTGRPAKWTPHEFISPFHVFTLLISAIGHDVGHPGVNNALLVALDAPVAQLYSDKSVLESYHCAAYSQILQKHWPAVHADKQLRRLMITTILATDMGLHFKYMNDLADMKSRYERELSSPEGASQKIIEEYRDLQCGLLIKCADISNVARPFECARKWALILTDEFSSQERIEKDLNVPTCLFGGPPDKNDITKLGQSQVGFISIFALPLFEAVTRVFPEVNFGAQQMRTNKAIWEDLIRHDPSDESTRAAPTIRSKQESHPAVPRIQCRQDGQVLSKVEPNAAASDEADKKVESNTAQSFTRPITSASTTTSYQPTSSQAGKPLTSDSGVFPGSVCGTNGPESASAESRNGSVRRSRFFLNSSSLRKLRAYKSLDKLKTTFSAGLVTNPAVLSLPIGILPTASDNDNSRADPSQNDRSAPSYTASSRQTSRDWSGDEQTGDGNRPQVRTAGSDTGKEPSEDEALTGAADPAMQIQQLQLKQQQLQQQQQPDLLNTNTSPNSCSNAPAAAAAAVAAAADRRPNRFSFAFWRNRRRQSPGSRLGADA